MILVTRRVAPWVSLKALRIEIEYDYPYIFDEIHEHSTFPRFDIIVTQTGDFVAEPGSHES
jgi:hypothetical protein